jgi:transcriptional regulator with XRE-family HTH domain
MNAPQRLPSFAMPLGYRLRNLRKHHRLSLRQLAASVGVSASTVHFWEVGRSNPTPAHMKALTDVFGLSEAEVLAGRKGASPIYSSRSLDGERASGDLADAISASKRRIADAAGVPAAQVKIFIEV